MRRDYDAIVRGLVAEPLPTAQTPRLQRIADVLWDELHDTGVSWVGFYLEVPDAPAEARLILGPRRDKPACSPIGLHGACGRAMLADATLIVRDVAELGPNYIACDPRDRSEIVVPLGAGTVKPGRGVLDLDSHEVGAFDQADDEGLCRVLQAAGLR